jgi:hypothetical protein
LGSIDSAEVRRELSLVLESASFRGSKRCHDFLSYVVTKALDGDSESLKERTLAVEVFGRRADVDLGENSIVRVGAREVRKRLAQYYITDGADDPIRIELLAGSYVPIFNRHTGVFTEVEPEPVSEPAAAPVRIPLPETKVWFFTRRWNFIGPWWMALAVLAIVLVPLSVWRIAHPAATEFSAFWQPAFDAKSPLLLALAHPLVYHPSSRATRLNEERNGPAATPLQRPIKVPPEMLDGSDYVPVFDQYVGFGDMVAAMKLWALFSQRSHMIRMKMADKLDFADMRDSPAVVLGAYSNWWTMELSQKLRFRFAFCGDKPCMVDSTSKKEWTLTAKNDDGRSPEDYLLICRLPRAETGGFVVVGAGMTQYGTEEVGRILADPEALIPVLKQLPPGWKARNMELVLHSKVVGESSTPPEMIASHLW